MCMSTSVALRLPPPSTVCLYYRSVLFFTCRYTIDFNVDGSKRELLIARKSNKRANKQTHTHTHTQTNNETSTALAIRRNVMLLTGVLQNGRSFWSILRLCDLALSVHACVAECLRERPACACDGCQIFVLHLGG